MFSRPCCCQLPLLADVEGRRRQRLRRRLWNETGGRRSRVTGHPGRGKAAGWITVSQSSRDARSLSPWVCGRCAMDILALGECTTADYAWLDDCPYVSDTVYASEFVPNDYVRVTQLYCNVVGRQYKDHAESERNLEFDICNMWCTKPVSVLRDYCDAIKIHIFWPLLFQHQHSAIVSRLYPCVEANSFHASEISLKELQHLELMEDIVDLAKKVMNNSFFIGGLLRIGYKIENNILAMEEALNWVKYTGDSAIISKLGAVENCWPMLSIFFTEYKYHITKVVTENCNILEEFERQTCLECIQQGELMKIKGNEEFSKERFDLAILYYSRAIEYSPENHHLYGNRALCFIRTGQFRNALGDGKRAIILKNNWSKRPDARRFVQEWAFLILSDTAFGLAEPPFRSGLELPFRLPTLPRGPEQLGRGARRLHMQITPPSLLG